MAGIDDHWFDVKSALKRVRESVLPHMSTGLANATFLKAMQSGEVRWRASRSASDISGLSDGLKQFWNFNTYIQGDQAVHLMRMGNKLHRVTFSSEISIVDLDCWLKRAGFGHPKVDLSEPTTSRKSREEKVRDATDALENIARKYLNRDEKLPNCKSHTTMAMRHLKRKFGEDRLKREDVSAIAKKQYAGQRRSRGERQR